MAQVFDVLSKLLFGDVVECASFEVPQFRELRSSCRPRNPG